ncbi:TonB-dependent siderophore receptor [Gallaecimonas pentaromativorans]|uniref:TonB-dependent siderophore receptor n=1 Tax=Gallaecimonas pentaromativorans TaxID=584787 RepID=UPI003A8D344B
MKSFALLPLAAFAAAYSLPILAATDDANNSDIERITVKGRAQSMYRIDDGSVAMKTATPLERTPQSVQILPLSLIEDQAATEVTDLYRSISGVSQYNYASVTFRGFRQNDVRYDGVRGDPYGDVSTPQLFNIQQVQVLKGPSGALYGAGDPGGLINYVTKKPGYQADNRIKLTAGNDDFVSGSLELSGPLTQAADQRYRLGLYQDHENPYRWNTDNRRRIIDTGYAIDLSDASTLTLQLTDVRQNEAGARLRGIPADSQGNFLASMRWNANEKSDFLRLTATVFQARLDHDFNDWLSADVTVRYFDNTERQKYHEPASADDTNGDGLADYTERQYRDQTRDTKAGSVTANLVAELGAHTLLLGGDFSHQKEDFYYQRARTADGVVGLSYSNPQYGVTDPASYRMRLITDSDTTAERYGFYLQDQWRITQAWDITGSARLDGFDDKVLDNIAGGEEHYNDTGFSYRLGSTYKINEHLHPYVSWSTGFTPQDVSSQLASNGGPFDPEESKQAELGLRSYWLDSAINLNLAAYHIERKNILQTDPDDTDRQIALGKVRSQGVEVDLLGDLSENWVINANYAYNDAVVKDATSGISRSVGKRFANAPRHQFGLWTRYDITALDSAIAFGADYVSEQFDQDGNRIKPYTVFDASWQTQWQAWQFQLNVKNLFDKAYAVSGLLGRTGQFPGERRRVYASASYRF